MNLLPDPPLSQMPELPENLRWRIEPRDNGDPLRWVHIDERREYQNFWGNTKYRWVSVAKSVWRDTKGFGNLNMVGRVYLHQLTGLASTCEHALMEYRKYQESLVTTECSDVYGVSKH